MNTTLQDKFVYHIRCLYITTENLIALDSVYNEDGICIERLDELKIYHKGKYITNKNDFIKHYEEICNQYAEIAKDLKTNIYPVMIGGRSLMKEIESNLTDANKQGYINRLCREISSEADFKKLIKGKYWSANAVDDLDYYLGVFIKKLYLLCCDYDVKLPDYIMESLYANQSDIKETLTKELDTEKARKYFNRAVETGYIDRTDIGYKWKQQQARLGYFCLKAYDAPRPIAALERCFNVSRLSASITQASYCVKRVDVKKWRADIDDKIFFD